MNRTIALFLAMAVLLAHALAIHGDANGDFAHPYDMAHVAYRMGRNFVHLGSFAWDPSRPGAESYPSVLWVGVAALAERLYVPVTVFCQTLGVLSALATVWVLAGFARERLAGIVAPLLLVTSGPVAAAAASGLETPVFALFVAGAFLAYEKRRAGALAVLLSLAVLGRPEGMLLFLALLAFECAGRRRARRNGSQRPSLLRAFPVPAAVALAVAAGRLALTGHLISPTFAELLAFDPTRMKRGLAYLADAFVGSGAPVLILLPLAYGALGRLPPVGRRALVLTLAWCALIALEGGGSMPMAVDLVPALPLLYLAVQEGVTLALDSRHTWLRSAAWWLFALGLTSSAMASKYPGDLGPLPTEALLRRWVEPRAQPRFGHQGALGRIGLAEEIELTGRLRSVGIFLRDHVDPSHTVLTPWPGAIGYLSRLHVIDALGRTTPLPGNDRVTSWSGAPRADVGEALSLEPDYIVPLIRFTNVAPTHQEIALAWLDELDRPNPGRPKRRLGLFEDLMRSYELIAVPISPSGREGEWRRPFFLMRRTDLGLSPELDVRLEQGVLRVDLRHRSHEQLADLRVLAHDREGRTWSLRPTGEFELDGGTLARTELLLFATGTRSVRLVEAVVPDELRGGELTVSLRNPGAAGEFEFARCSAEVRLLIQ